MVEPRSEGTVTDEERRLLAESHGGQAGSTLALSYSRMHRYQQCPRAYQLQFIEGVPTEPSGAAIAGSAAHAVIEEMILDGWWGSAEVVAEEAPRAFQTVFDRKLVEEGGTFVEDVLPEGTPFRRVEGIRWAGRKRLLRDEDGKEIRAADGSKVLIGEDYRWMLQNGPTWIKRAGGILRRDQRSGLYIVEANVERRVSAWLDEPGGTLITGIIDLTLLVQESPGGDLPVIRDWKTGTFIEPFQMANYAWLLMNVDDPTARISTTRGQIAYLRGKTEDTWLRDYDLAEWIPLVPEFFREMLHGLEGTHFPMQPSSWCGSCWVRQFCPWGRTLHED